MPEYEAWKESVSGNASGWTIKYYKVSTSISNCTLSHIICGTYAGSLLLVLVMLLPGAGNKHIRRRKRIFPWN